jgi:hypothetical protein
MPKEFSSQGDFDLEPGHLSVISIVWIIIDASILVGKESCPAKSWGLSTVNLFVGMYWIRAGLSRIHKKKHRNYVTFANYALLCTVNLKMDLWWTVMAKQLDSHRGRRCYQA